MRDVRDGKLQDDRELPAAADGAGAYVRLLAPDGALLAVGRRAEAAGSRSCPRILLTNPRHIRHKIHAPKNEIETERGYA